MKRLFTCIALALPFFALAQNTEGHIVFQESVKFEIQLPEGQEEMAKMLPNSQSFDMILHFNEAASVYKNYDKAEDSQSEWTSNEGGNTIKMIIQRPENQFYKDLQEKRKVEMREFLGKRFLIKDELETLQWKVTGEQQMILDYPCIKATLQDEDEEKNIVAWFTPQIPVSNGPGKYGQLPGMILAVDIDEGQRTLTATNIVMGESQADHLKEPTKGKEVSQEEYDKIEAKKKKEMEAEGGEGGIMIKIRH